MNYEEPATVKYNDEFGDTKLSEPECNAAKGLPIEQLKLAKEIGATVFNQYSHVLKKYDEDGAKLAYTNKLWHVVDLDGHPVRGDIEIDFSALDEYYADKAVDIAATSVPDGYYHCDEEDKLKPLKPAKTDCELPVETCGEQFELEDFNKIVAIPDYYRTVFSISVPTGTTGQLNPPSDQPTNEIELLNAVRTVLGLDGFVAYCRGNAIEYVRKEGTAQNLRMAAWYLNQAADELTKAEEIGK